MLTLQIILTVFNGLCFPLLSWFVFGAFQTSLKVAKDDDEQVKGMGHVYATLFVQCAPMVMVFSLVATWCLQVLPLSIYWIFSLLPLFVLVLFFANLLTFEIGRGQVVRSTRALLNKGRGHIFSGPVQGGEGSVTSSVTRDGWEWWENLRSKRKSGELAVLDESTKVDVLPGSSPSGRAPDDPKSALGISIVVEEPDDEQRKTSLRTCSPISLREVDQHGDLLSPFSNPSHRPHSQAISSFSSQVTSYIPPVNPKADAARLHYAVAVYPWRTFCRWTKSWSAPMPDRSNSDPPSDSGTGSTKVDRSIGELTKESGYISGVSRSDEEENFGNSLVDQDIHSTEPRYEITDSESIARNRRNPEYLRQLSLKDDANVPGFMEIDKNSTRPSLHPLKLCLNIVLLVILFPVLLITRLSLFCIIYLIVTLPLLIISTLFFPIASILCAFLHLYDVFSDTSETSGFHFFYTPSVILIWIASSFVAVLVVPCVLSGHYILGLIVWGLRRAVPVIGDERFENISSRTSPGVRVAQPMGPPSTGIELKDCAVLHRGQAGDPILTVDQTEIAVPEPEAVTDHGPVQPESTISKDPCETPALTISQPLETVIDIVPNREELRLCAGSRLQTPATYEKGASLIPTAADLSTIPASAPFQEEPDVEIGIQSFDPNPDTPGSVPKRPSNEQDGDDASNGFKFWITPNIRCPTLPFRRIVFDSYRRIWEDVRRQKVFLYG